MTEERTRDIVPTPRSLFEPAVSRGRFHLLAIGIDDYGRRGHHPPLQTAVHGALEVTQTLQEQYGFLPEQTTCLLDGEATREAILDELHALARRVGEHDSLLVYYAGHGTLDSDLSIGYWIPANGETNRPATWVENSVVKSIFRGTRARHVLLISDSCFAGDYFRGSSAPAEITDAYTRTAFGRRSRQALTSGGLQPVRDGGFENHSPFTAFLLHELRESRKPYLLPQDLFARIRCGVAANARQQPMLGLLHDAGGELGGEFVLFRSGQRRTREGVPVTRERDERLTNRRAAPVAVCPLCGHRNEVMNTFRCRVCGQDYLCLGHFIDGDRCCEDCGVKLAREREQAEAEARGRAEREARERERRQAQERRRNPALATREQPWENSLGMRFVPVPGTQVLFSIWLTRVGDFRVFANCSVGGACEIPGREGSFLVGGQYSGKSQGWKRGWDNPGFVQDDDHPVTCVRWDVAKAFCDWLTREERANGWLSRHESYRLPTDEEWSWAAGIGDREEPGTPKDKDSRLHGVYPWGAGWPPPPGAGNFAGVEAADNGVHEVFDVIPGYSDDYVCSSPVGSFSSDRHGLYDLSGNVWEWCEDFYDGRSGSRVLRGGSWKDGRPDSLLSSYRHVDYPVDRHGDYYGFRCVLEFSR